MKGLTPSRTDPERETVVAVQPGKKTVSVAEDLVKPAAIQPAASRDSKSLQRHSSRKQPAITEKQPSRAAELKKYSGKEATPDKVPSPAFPLKNSTSGVDESVEFDDVTSLSVCWRSDSCFCL